MNKLPVYKTEGIILKAADWGDLDRLLTIYTRGYGKIQARAISVKKKDSKLKGLLQGFTCGNFLLAKSKTIDIITDLEVINSYQYLHSHLVNLGYAWYFAELIDKLIVAPERDENIWRLVARVFESSNNPTPPPLNLRGGEIHPNPPLQKEGIPPLKLRGGEGELSQIRIAFEDMLVEFLGHGEIKTAQRLNYLQALAGEQINSQKFLAFV